MLYGQAAMLSGYAAQLNIFAVLLDQLQHVYYWHNHY